MEEWRSILYPLGFLSSIAFAARFIIQWIQSERKQESLVPRTFWQISLVGNLFLTLHTFIQFQFHVCLIQSCNCIISWRNLSLMSDSPKKMPFARVLLWLLGASFFVTIAFFIQDTLAFGSSWDWFRSPKNQWQNSSIDSFPIYWHLMGFLAYILFSSRFWIQWFFAEKNQRSDLSISFWWISLCGAVLAVVYFFSINDYVNLVGPGIGIVPYIRNLMLIYKKRKQLAFYEQKT